MITCAKCWKSVVHVKPVTVRGETFHPSCGRIVARLATKAPHGPVPIKGHRKKPRPKPDSKRKPTLRQQAERQRRREWWAANSERLNEAMGG